MDNRDNIFGEDLTFGHKIDEDFNARDKTIDFLSAERSDEKTDAKKEKNVDDFLNFHDDFGDQPPHNDYLQSNPILMPTIEKKEEPKAKIEPETDFHAAGDDYLNPYGGIKANDKFISSEDLLTDFKDPIPEPSPQKEELPKPIIPKSQPVVEEKKKEVAPNIETSTKKQKVEPQIEAEKIFNSIGLGE